VGGERWEIAGVGMDVGVERGRGSEQETTASAVGHSRCGEAGVLVLLLLVLQ